MRIASFTPGYTPPSTSTGTSGASAAVYNQVSQMMQSQNTIAPKLNAAIATDQTTLSGLGKLSSLLATFQGMANSVSGSGMLAAATSSDKSILTASSTGSSLSGTYAINVQQLAQAQTLTSKSISSATAALGPGNPNGTTSTINIEFGITSGGKFTPNGDTAKAISIPDGASLQDVAAAINKANVGVQASVVQKGDAYALVLNSPVGAAGSMRISTDGDPSLKGLLGFDPAGAKGMSQTSTAQDAQYTVDGVAASSPSNTIAGKGSLAGINLTLKASGTSTLSVVQDSSQIASNVNMLVTNYNALNSSLNSLKQGALQSDAVVDQVKTQLASTISGLSGSLSAIGISIAGNGDMQVDKTKLQNAINTDPDTVAKLFTDNGKGIADRWSSQIAAITASDGSIAKDSTRVNKDIDTLNTKKDTVAKALTAQANALADFYTKQGTQFNGITGLEDGQPTSLFDMI
ncbi:flagellar filament capping protein FliD [Undibacterium sp. TJN25]|uniref:flagellar filament capping protein FliD n=1 Tax=Undibacterium sp. TJN25 TaxID=3413056 RepID=UPI003BF1907F